jgi:adenylylsulfate kinase
VIHLDGDELRQALGETTYNREDRLSLGKRYARICRLISRQKVNVVIAVIGLFQELHEWNRNNIPGYLEIFLDVPMEELQKRDPKGLYKKARMGELKDVAGLDMQVDLPQNPHVHLTWKPGMTIEMMWENFQTGIDKAISVPK